jgi:lipopolysaccharide/colanic/teichoic acid biosynthesis glycosyltransferase
MFKRLFDLAVSSMGLLFASPILLPVITLVWMQDGQSPFYISYRVGKKEKLFKMIKLRSMVVNADKSGVDSTSANDSRITPIGHFIRNYKLDELTQLWNVFLGDMSLVGPRPNGEAEVKIYTTEEKMLLSIRPGITDFASIIFSDEGAILEDKENPDLSYNQLIRPWKSRLGLVYIQNRSLLIDFQLIFFTIISILSREKAVQWVVSKLISFDVDNRLIEISKRKSDLYPFPPPGSSEIVYHR